MSIIIKLITLFISVTVLSKTYLDYKKKKETFSMFLFWTITWLAVLFFAIWPRIYLNVKEYFNNFGVGSVTFVGLIFIFLFFVTYRVYVKTHRLERQVRDLVMKIGLKDVEE